MGRHRHSNVEADLNVTLLRNSLPCPRFTDCLAVVFVSTDLRQSPPVASPS